MIKELVENYAKASRELNELTGFIAFPELLQCKLEKLTQFAQENDLEITVKDYSVEKYVYKVSVIVEGHEFYAIATEEDFQKYVKGNVA